MKSLKQQTKRGFTLIEVALVLAIAGLIFLMVFQIVPTVRGTQRDTVRNEDLGTVQAALMRWQNSHNGNLPSPKKSKNDATSTLSNQWAGTETFDSDCTSNVACQFVRDYINSAVVGTGDTRTNSFTDPSGEFYNVVITKNASKDDDFKDIQELAWSGDAASSDSGGASNEEAVSKLTKTASNAEEDGGIIIDTSIDGAFDKHVMYILPGTTCEEDHAVRSTRNNFSILYYTERSGVTCRGTSS